MQITSLTLATLLISGAYGGAAAAENGPRNDAAETRPAAVLEDATLPGFTIYRPRDLPSDAALPVVLWGEGSCRNAGNLYSEFNSEIASHGYLVIAIGPIVRGATLSSPPKPTASTPAASEPTTLLFTPHETKSERLIDALNGIVAQNGLVGSPYANHVDVDHVAAMGHSCGGIQAAWAAVHDSRIKTLIFANSGILDPLVSGIPISRADLSSVRVPVLYLLGGPTDLAHPVAQADLPHYDGSPVFMGDLNVGHYATYLDFRGGEFAKITVAWLDWQLKGQAEPRSEFVGARCTLCIDPRWKIERRNFTIR